MYVSSVDFLNQKYLAKVIILSYTLDHSGNMVKWQQREIRSDPRHKHNKKVQVMISYRKFYSKSLLSFLFLHL